jgi:hypothetical protein
MSEIRKQKFTQFIGWVRQYITGDEKGQAQIFLDRLFQAFGQKGSLDVGGTPELRIRKATEDGGGIALADHTLKTNVEVKLKKLLECKRPRGHSPASPPCAPPTVVIQRGLDTLRYINASNSTCHYRHGLGIMN